MAVALRTAEPTSRRRSLLLSLAAVIVVAVPIVQSTLTGAAAGRRSTVRYSNTDGGYALRYPSGWHAATEGSTARFTSPARDVVVGIGRLEGEMLQQAARTFTGALLESYRQVRADAGTRRAIGGRPAIWIAGSAVNRSGVALRWLAITIDAGARTYGVSVFTPTGSDPRDVLPQVEVIVASLRPL
jgi:hypothetical protein